YRGRIGLRQECGGGAAHFEGVYGRALGPVPHIRGAGTDNPQRGARSDTAVRLDYRVRIHEHDLLVAALEVYALFLRSPRRDGEVHLEFLADADVRRSTERAGEHLRRLDEERAFTTGEARRRDAQRDFLAVEA